MAPTLATAPAYPQQINFISHAWYGVASCSYHHNQPVAVYLGQVVAGPAQVRLIGQDHAATFVIVEPETVGVTDSIFFSVAPTPAKVAKVDAFLIRGLAGLAGVWLISNFGNRLMRSPPKLRADASRPPLRHPQ